jgi:hypothetical protein
MSVMKNPCALMRAVLTEVAACTPSGANVAAQMPAMTNSLARRLMRAWWREWLKLVLAVACSCVIQGHR